MVRRLFIIKAISEMTSLKRLKNDYRNADLKPMPLRILDTDESSTSFEVCHQSLSGRFHSKLRKDFWIVNDFLPIDIE